MIRALRIAGAGGFWGDRHDALLDQVCGGSIDVVTLDYLSEVTMAMLRGRRLRDPGSGWATDFMAALGPALPNVVKRGIKIVTNAGGANPYACADAVLGLARDRGLRGLRVGVVTGDDIFDRIDELYAAGVTLDNVDTGAPLITVRERLLAANAYLGAEPIAKALGAGAQIVIAGRCSDSALALGALLAHFGWADDDWTRRAAGVVAGHLVQHGAQASGGNFAGGWEEVPQLARLGYPIAEVDESGELEVSKHPGLGGQVSSAVVAEQLLYKVGDPRSFVTPDAVADFTDIELEDFGDDRVRLHGVRGFPPPDALPASLAFQEGWRNVATITFVWPYATARARATEAILLERCRNLGIRIDAHHVDLVGLTGAHGPLAPAPAGDPNEVVWRLAIRTEDRESARRFGAEIAPLVASGLPGACRGTGSLRPTPTPIISFWPAQVPRAAVAPSVEVLVA
ncbi:MAG: DUF1446 domain-containing protein [Myxococcales bacterium]|nr:DUF1446 domain-containing protein [Myxococcales bacterium]